MNIVKIETVPLKFWTILVFLAVLSHGFPNNSAHEKELETFDFIVVGGGTAGCVVAGRLSENGKHSVLLLEAGRVPTEDMDIPAFAPTYQVDPSMTFQYTSVPQENASLAYNGIINIPLGKVLGGTSSINYMFYNRGHPNDYNNWANITNDPSWNYTNLMEHFKNLEDYNGDFPSDQHGRNGPLSITNQSYAPGLETWLEAGKVLGYEIADPNGPQRISFAPVEYNKQLGRRVSSYTGFIKPYENTSGNLKVVTNALVNEIILDISKTKAIGVKYQLNQSGESISVSVDKEVIISAGAYGSPILLMKSGIGPQKVLADAGITQVKELPVGENLQDHPIVPVQLIINNRTLLFDAERDLTPENFELFRLHGEGPYTTTAGLFAQAFVASTVAVAEGESDWADIQFSMYAQTFLTGLPNTTMGEWEAPIYAYPYLARQKSRGTVKINPEDVDGQPLIDFNFLSDPRDIQITIDAIKMTMKILEETPPYMFIGARYPPVALEACRQLHFRSDEYWRYCIPQYA